MKRFLALIISFLIPGSLLAGFVGPSPGFIHTWTSVSVKEAPFNAYGDGIHNDTAAFNAAISYVGSFPNGGTVFVPDGEYNLWHMTRTSNPNNTSAADGQAITVNSSNIVLTGNSKYTCILNFLSNTGAGPATSFQVLNGQVWRGGGIFIEAGANTSNPNKNIEIRNLTLNGGSGYTDNNTFPANTTTGDGWDITNKAIWLQNNGAIGDVMIENCTITAWRGEEIYQSGTNSNYLTVEDSSLGNTNGDDLAYSMGGKIFRNVFDQTAASGIDNSIAYYPSIIQQNFLKNINSYGIDESALGPQITITNNQFLNDGFGSYINNSSNVVNSNNTYVDCGWAPNNSAIIVAGNSGPSSNISVENNQIWCDTVNLNNGIEWAGTGADTVFTSVCRNNVINVTANAVSVGVSILNGYDYATDASPSNLIFDNNSSNGAVFTYTNKQAVCDLPITTTSPVTLVTTRPVNAANYCANYYFQITANSSPLTVFTNWYDYNNVQHSVTVLASTGLSAGVTNIPPLYFTAYGTSSHFINTVESAGNTFSVRATANINKVPSL